MTCAAPSSQRRSRRSAAALGLATRRAGANLSRPPDPDDRAVSAGRTGRYHGPHRRPGPAADPRTIRHHREPAGASGTIGAKAVAGSAPDGYTLLFRQHQLARGDAGLPTTATSIRTRPSPPSPRPRRTTRCWWCIRTSRQNRSANLWRWPRPIPPAQLRLRGIGNATHLAAELFKQRTGIESSTCHTKAQPKPLPA